MKILLVHDDQQIGNIVKESAVKGGHHVSVSNGLFTFTQSLQNNSFDIVIVQISMMHGYISDGIIQIVQKYNPGSKLWVTYAGDCNNVPISRLKDNGVDEVIFIHDLYDHIKLL